jgi:hypothetical protein
MKRNRKPKQTRRDGALPLARRRLEDAITELVHIRRHTIRLDVGDGGLSRLKRVKLLSRYDELSEAVEAHRGGSGGQWNGQFPFWVDALVLVAEIDTAVLAMHPEPHRWPGWTVERLRALEAQKWRPQDCPLIFAHAKTLESYCKRADGLFAPRPIPLPDPCPECGEDHVYHEQDGEEVRQAALQITELGATCGNSECRANWPIEMLPMLGRLLKAVRDAAEQEVEEVEEVEVDG